MRATLAMSGPEKRWIYSQFCSQCGAATEEALVDISGHVYVRKSMGHERKHSSFMRKVSNYDVGDVVIVGKSKFEILKVFKKDGSWKYDVKRIEE